MTDAVETARELLRRGQEKIALQQSLIALMKAAGRPTEVAEALLEELLNNQREHEARVGRLMLAGEERK